MSQRAGRPPRIISGRAGGRRLQVPPAGTRPSSDRLRESLFSSLMSDRSLVGARVLDLFAGSGALGLEALSRGAQDAVFVEAARRAAEACERNVADIGLGGTVVEVDVRRFLKPPRRSGRFDLVLADPPYSMPARDVDAVLVALGEGGWLADWARVVIERDAGSRAPRWPEGFTAVPVSAIGGTVVHRAVWYRPVTAAPEPTAHG